MTVEKPASYNRDAGLNKGHIACLVAILAVGLLSPIWLEGNSLISGGNLEYSISPKDYLARYNPKVEEHLLGQDGVWTEPVQVPLKEGLHEVEIVPSKALKMDLAEIANKSYVPQQPKATLDFRKINPTRYVVSVDAQGPFWLVLSESYHEGWKAYIIDTSSKQRMANKKESRPWYEWSALLTWLFEGRKRIEVKDHYLVNAYANGWYVPKTGQYKITLEYTPQRLFEIGVLVSFITFVGCIGYLGYDWRSRRGATEQNSKIEQLEAEDLC